jgi:hypothetical protein
MDSERTNACRVVLILDNFYASLPSPPFTEEDKESTAKLVYHHVWQFEYLNLPINKARACLRLASMTTANLGAWDEVGLEPGALFQSYFQ